MKYDYYKMAFDITQRDKQVQIFNELELEQRDARIITNLYWNQTASVSIGNMTTRSKQILRELARAGFYSH